MTAPAPWPQREWPEAIPRWVTPRNYDRDTIGPQLEEVAWNLGFEPMPWNKDNWATMGEYVTTPAGTKKLWYREAVISVPRQSSKTTGTLVRHSHRCTYAERNGWLRPGERSVCAFTMQHQNDAAKKMKEVWHPILQPNDGHNEWTHEHVRRCMQGSGSVSVEWRNGSHMGVFPPNLTGAHGDTLDLVDVDEAFALPDDRAEQGARPAMITRLSPQIVI